MNKLINRKVLISMIFIGLTMMGLFSYRYLLMELYPDAEFPSLNVTISTKEIIRCPSEGVPDVVFGPEYFFSDVSCSVV